VEDLLGEEEEDAPAADGAALDASEPFTLSEEPSRPPGRRSPPPVRFGALRPPRPISILPRRVPFDPITFANRLRG